MGGCRGGVMNRECTFWGAFIQAGAAMLAVLRETSSKASLAGACCSASLSLSLLSKAREATEAEATEGGSAATGATALSAAKLAALNACC